MTSTSHRASPARLPRPCAWALPAALATALLGFQLVFGLRLASARDAFWSNPPGDMGQMLAGEIAGLRAPWRVPILTPDTLLAPERTSLVYTDSIPWLTALLKLTHLGPTLSLLGTFLLLAWLAQAGAMYALLRAAGVRRATTLLAGSLLALLVPAWLGRQVGHIALAGHAVQIAALALAVHGARAGLGARSVAAFVALGVLAAGVHAYHVPVVTLLFASALASEALQRRAGAGMRIAAGAAAYLAALAAAAAFLGYFVGQGGAAGGAGALGFYEMNALAPVLPQASALAGQRWTGGWFTHPFDPTGGQGYEGFDYLGAGVLLLLAAAAAAVWRERRGGAAERTPPQVRGWRRWAPLAAALGLLWLYALGTRPYVGTVRLFALPLPDAGWVAPLSLFRCHGRFFWPVAYALVAGALVALDRSAWPRGRPALLAAAVALQAADMSQMLLGLHDRFSHPEPLRAPVALTTAAFRARDYRVYPGFFCTQAQTNETLLRQLALIAQRQGASTNAAETARPPRDGCAPPPPDARVDAAPGDRRLTVLTSDDGAPSDVTSLFTARGDCRRLDGWWMCGRDLAGLPGSFPAPGATLAGRLTPDAELSVGSSAFAAALASGWSKVEPTGVWSDGPRAVLRLPRPDLPPGRPLAVTVDALGYQPPGRPAQRVEASVGGRRLAASRLDGMGYRGMRVTVPAELLTPGAPLDLVLDLPDALSPNLVVPGSGDPRRLGVGIRRVTLAH